ncbi:hypothetical protein WJX74_004180 [Apatococcus lobatus]|uniref:Uncharacterized protein n=1 Tax=Apatococcus lobatus TaxID=904363 RepID=A0AAW1S3F3_9CHLO
MSYLAGMRIGISGAGIAITAFALALEQACKASRVVRLLQLGLLDELEQLQEPGSNVHFCYRNLDPLLAFSPQKNKAGEFSTQTTMRIMRAHLQRALLDRVPSDCVHYGKLAQSALPAAQPDGPVQLSFADGSRAECDLLVVADGANRQNESLGAGSSAASEGAAHNAWQGQHLHDPWHRGQEHGHVGTQPQRPPVLSRGDFCSASRPCCRPGFFGHRASQDNGRLWRANAQHAAPHTSLLHYLHPGLGKGNSSVA